MFVCARWSLLLSAAGFMRLMWWADCWGCSIQEQVKAQNDPTVKTSTFQYSSDHKRRKMLLFYSSFQNEMHTTLLLLGFKLVYSHLACQSQQEKSVEETTGHVTWTKSPFWFIWLTDSKYNKGADYNDGCCMCTTFHHSPHQQYFKMMCFNYGVKNVSLVKELS